MEIISLKNVAFTSIYNAFNNAFEDYEIQLNEKQLSVMLTRRGFVPELSFAAYDDGRIISFTFNGIGNYNGIPAAYDTGTGTLKEYRGKGVASRVFEYSVPVLKAAGVKQYLLEVLQHNSAAVSVYQKQGFEMVREFGYFTQNSDKLFLKDKKLPGLAIKPVDLDACKQSSSFWDFCPSWQNSFDAIERCSGDFLMFGAFLGNQIVGYAILEPNSGDLTQLAVEPEVRRRGVGTLLLNEVVGYNQYSTIKAINTEITCTAITSFLESAGIPMRGKQYEMSKML